MVNIGNSYQNIRLDYTLYKWSETIVLPKDYGFYFTKEVDEYEFYITRSTKTNAK